MPLSRGADQSELRTLSICTKLRARFMASQPAASAKNASVNGTLIVGRSVAKFECEEALLPKGVTRARGNLVCFDLPRGRRCASRQFDQSKRDRPVKRIELAQAVPYGAGHEITGAGSGRPGFPGRLRK